MQTNTAIQFNNTTITVQKSLILRDLSFSILQGDFIYLYSTNAIERNSLLKTMYGALPIRSGTAMVCNHSLHQIKSQDIPFLRRKLGIVRDDLKLIPYLTVSQNLQLTLEATDWDNNQNLQYRVTQVLQMQELVHLSNKKASQLTEKEKVQVKIARALLNNPLLLLLDAPTEHLDASATAEVLKFLQEYNKQTNTTIVFATANKAIIQNYPADTTFVCQNQTIKELEIA